jgi:hypothetical protein
VEKVNVKVEKTEKICGFVKPEKCYAFDKICDDQFFFERENNMRHYVICVSCGFIPISMIDQDTKFTDLHCRCGNPAIYSSFSEDEILKIIDDTKVSTDFRDLLKDACNDIQ